LIAVFSLLTIGALALNAADYNLTWQTVDGGGGASSSASYSLSGSAGQPDAGTPLTGGSYRLAGGFWVNNSQLINLYLPLIKR
jgi:hypothetical protein